VVLHFGAVESLAVGRAEVLEDGLDLPRWSSGAESKEDLAGHEVGLAGRAGAERAGSAERDDAGREQQRATPETVRGQGVQAGPPDTAQPLNVTGAVGPLPLI